MTDESTPKGFDAFTSEVIEKLADQLSKVTDFDKLADMNEGLAPEDKDNLLTARIAHSQAVREGYKLNSSEARTANAHICRALIELIQVVERMAARQAQEPRS